MKFKYIQLTLFLLSSSLLKAQFQFNQAKEFASSLDYNLSVAHLTNGDKVVSGLVVDTVKLSASVQLIRSSERSVYVARYAKNGNLLWHYLVKGSSSSSSIAPNAGVKTDNDDNIYVAGNFSGNVAFSSSIVKNGGVLGSVFYLKLDSTGAFKHVGFLGNAFCTDFDITSNQRVVIGGNIATNPRNAMVAKFLANGQINGYEVKKFNGSKNNRDQITAVCIDDDDNIYFAGKCNGSSISINGLNTTVSGPNDINKYTLFLGKISSTNWASWLKGAVPIPGNRPYSFDIKEMQYHNNHKAIVMAGLFSGANFSIDGDTLAITSTVNSDSRKPIIISIDSTGKYNYNTSLGLDLESQRGEIFTISLQDRYYVVSAELENYDFDDLALGQFVIKRSEKSLVVATIDSVGNVVSATGTDPADKINIFQVNSASYNAETGFALSLVQNAHNKIEFGNAVFSTGSTLLSAIYCGGEKLLISGNEKVCKGDSIKLTITGKWQTIDWFLNGANYTQGKSEIYVRDSSLIYVKVTSEKGCFVISDSVSVIFNRSPNVKISGLNGGYCIDDESDSIIFSPNGGVLTGIGVVNANFNPREAGVGKHTVNYVFKNANGCEAKTEVNLEVFPRPDVSILNLDTSYCDNDEAVILKGNPANGVFSGIGVNNNKLNPAVGNFGKRLVSYYFEDNNGCSNLDTVYIDIFESTKVSFSGLDTAYCPDDSTIVLLASVQGGAFSGKGITDSGFNPFNAGVGRHLITYTYTNSFGCTTLHQENTRVRRKSECELSLDAFSYGQLQVYPNPSKGLVHIKSDANVGQINSITVFDYLGRNVFTSNSKNRLSEVSLYLENKGLYFVQFETADERFYIPVVVE